MANQDAARKRKLSATEDQDRARAAGSRKPGVVGRMMEQCRETVEAIRLPRPDWRTFAWGLLLLILIIFIVANWAPLRINFFGWYLDAPRAVVFAIFFALGMVTTWLIEVRSRRARAVGEEEEEEVGRAQPAANDVWAGDLDDVLATEIPPDEFEPAPEDFAEVGEGSASAPEQSTVIEHFDEAEEDVAEFEASTDVLAEDETAGDAFSDDYRFKDRADQAEAADIMGDESLERADEWGAEPDSVEDAADDESAEDDDSSTPFWRK